MDVRVAVLKRIVCLKIFDDFFAQSDQYCYFCASQFWFCAVNAGRRQLQITLPFDTSTETNFDFPSTVAQGASQCVARGRLNERAVSYTKNLCYVGVTFPKFL